MWLLGLLKLKKTYKELYPLTPLMNEMKYNFAMPTQPTYTCSKSMAARE